MELKALISWKILYIILKLGKEESLGKFKPFFLISQQQIENEVITGDDNLGDLGCIYIKILRKDNHQSIPMVPKKKGGNQRRYPFAMSGVLKLFKRLSDFNQTGVYQFIRKGFKK